MTYEYYANGGGIVHMEVKSDDKNIMMCLDPNEPEHNAIITAIGEDESKALKYATYLHNGGCEYFNLDEILTTINN